MTWRGGYGKTGDNLVKAAGYAEIIRAAWRTHTYGEMAAMTGLSPTTLHDVMHGERQTIRLRTAVKLEALRGLTR
jgi:hypothetical protein